MKIITLVERVFFQFIRLERSAPVYHSSPTQEVEWPDRHGTGHIFHPPLTKIGLVIGRWDKTDPVDGLDRVKEAIGGRDLNLEDLSGAGSSASSDAQPEVGPGEAVDAGSPGPSPHA